MASWRKLKKLGQGSYATVFLAAEDDNSFFIQSPLLAVKATSNPVGYSSLKVEGKFLNEVKGSPYVVRCFGEDMSIENGTRMYNLLLEYAPGGTLHELIHRYRGNMPEPLVAFYSYMLLRALSHIHHRGVVHCDIKPANVLVFPTLDDFGHLKLADFGLAKKEDDIEACYHGRLGKNRGTLLYASPESVLQGIHKSPSDIWALGITIIEMIRGEWAWTFRNTSDLANKITQSQPKIPTNISKLGQDFLKSFFVTDPSQRPTADTLLNHPFIINNMMATTKFHNRKLVLQSNPFGSAPWTSKKGMFSTPSGFTSMDSGIKYYRRFPEGGILDVLHRVWNFPREATMAGHLLAK